MMDLEHRNPALFGQLAWDLGNGFPLFRLLDPIMMAAEAMSGETISRK
jgi:hypothetical protein